MEPGTGSRTNVPIPANGLTTVFEPTQPSVDIVFIHGFTGHPERTWTKAKGDIDRRDVGSTTQAVERPHKIRKLNILPNDKPNPSHGSRSVFWPRDLLPATVPDARVMTYGYDTHIRHRLGPEGSQSTVYDISWDFLVALEASRRSEPTRPIIFIAHSLGGIVVKEMLRRASIYRLGQSHLRPVFDSTKGVLFFGTPHGGSDPRGFLQKFAEQLFRATGFTVNQQIVNTLLPSSERLRELRDEFAPMARQQGWIIHSFQEQIGVKALSSDKVVDDTSSYLNAPDLEVTEHIGQNHMEMCRFVGPHDPEYRKVAAAITHITPAECKIVSDPISTQDPHIDSQELENILDLLRFGQHDARHHNIKSAHAKTCKWLLKSDSYLEWAEPKHIENHHGFFWIKGKPGTGKSTIMKFLLANAKRRLRGSLILTFFFNARGHALERSTIGMYRSLLLQILEQKPSLRPILGTDLLRSKRGWSLELLKSVFEQAIQSIVDTPVVCIVDALDECPEKEVREMVSSFSHLGQLVASDERRFKVCFSSRHYPYITIDKKIELVLEENEGHSEDISQYVASELKIGQGKLADEVKETVRIKSSGIFMWVVLVVQILNKEHDTGRVYKIRQRLKEIPKDLHELFRDILTRDARNGEELILCLQWVLFARRPLAPAELYSAVLSGADSDAIRDCDMEELSESDFDRYILDCSKGLVETTKTKHRTSQFIHESVRDFLLKNNGFASMIAENESHGFEALSHDKLKHCCFIQMGIGRSLHKSASYSTKFPFLRYAVDNILHHTDKAQELGRSQSKFLAGFPVADWVALSNLFKKYEIRKYPPNARLVYILTEKNLYHLISSYQTTTSPLEMGQERYKCPLVAALVMRSQEASKELLRQVVQTLPDEHGTRLLLDELFSREDALPFLQPDFKYSSFGNMCLEINKSDVGGSDELLTFFIKVGLLKDKDKHIQGSNGFFQTALTCRRELLVIELMKRDNHYYCSLHQAVTYNLPKVAKFILENGGTTELDNINAGKTPLELALDHGNRGLIELLLEFGADANRLSACGDPQLVRLIRSYEPAKYISIEVLMGSRSLDANVSDTLHRTPLIWAASCGDEMVLKLILGSGKVDVNARDMLGRTSLSHAAERANRKAVELLLDSDADATIVDNDGRTPLFWAVEENSVEVAQLLIDVGRSDVTAHDNEGRTPLIWAAKAKAYGMVQLLTK
ncbi:hypothetical protein PG987_005781 [Apiospora arundinis]